MCQRTSYRTRGGHCGFHGPFNQGGNRGGDSASYQRAHREASLLPPTDATIVEVLGPQEHIHEHNVDQTQASTTSQINAKIAE